MISTAIRLAHLSLASEQMFWLREQKLVRTHPQEKRVWTHHFDFDSPITLTSLCEPISLTLTEIPQLDGLRNLLVI
jgi:hypothetical protein